MSANEETSGNVQITEESAPKPAKKAVAKPKKKAPAKKAPVAPKKPEKAPEPQESPADDQNVDA